MMRQVCLCFLLMSIWGCGGSDTAGPATGSASVSAAPSGNDFRESVARIMAVEGVERHAQACDFLSSRDVIPQMFTISSNLVTYRPMTMKSIPHAYCGALWEKPNKAELKEAHKKVMADYGQRKVKAMLAREPFDEAIPKPEPEEFSVSVTFASPMFDSSEEAISALKSRRSSLAKGVEVEVMGEARTVKMDDFEGWTDDIGDGGAWSSRDDALSVVFEGVILTVTAKGFGDDEQNRARAMELANYLFSDSI